ncbi:MAG: hypothetical protein RBG1_1C00001G1245 [candidate division Zixibacteria bacterium RBG-1]|nr:MAG: hypothetical protein RBG1_1C00001G1245 [candidate division Zixibacteria bacterium RBG-1]OGC84247.1 MAG: hypothetical protein A2V73_05235 [candidate division Zixibacteria bacterium RBG_19FT_COMBO_42_43]
MRKSIFITFILLFNFYLAFSADSDLKTLHDNTQKTLTTQPAYFDSSQGRFIPQCGTSHFVEFNFVKNQAATDPSKSLGPLFHIPRPSYGSRTELTYNSPTGFFKIHYVLAGDSAVYQPTVDSDGDGHPDYVEKVADIFDSVWIFEVNGLSYRKPPSDGWYPGGFDNGGDSLYDVYLAELAPAFYGYTVPETTAGPSFSQSFTSYIVLRNDYPVPPFPNRPIYDNVRVTVAHEFFHSIHFGYDVFEYEYIPGNADSVRPYWLELSATWMEDLVYDYINDYLAYLPFFYNYPWLSLRTFSYNFSFPDRVFHPYASCVWAFYLQEIYGTDIIRRIWEKCGAVSGFNFLTATDEALREVTDPDKGIAEAFTEFTIWNYFTGDRALFGNYYTEANLFGIEIKIDTLHTVTSADTVFVTPGIKSNPPQNFAANYVVFIPMPLSAQDSIGGLNMEFYEAIAGAGWRISAIPYNLGSVPVTSEFDTLIVGQWYDSTANWASYDSVIMVPTPINFSTNFSGWQYGYKVNYDSILSAPSSFLSRDTIFQNFPNPFVIRNPSDVTYFPVTVSEQSHVFVDILTPDGNIVKRLKTNQPLPGNSAYKNKFSLQNTGLEWDGKNEKGQTVASGVYFYRVKTQNAEKLMKLVVVREK